MDNNLDDVLKFKYLYKDNIEVPSQGQTNVVMGNINAISNYTCIGVIPLHNHFSDNVGVTYGTYAGGTLIYACLKSYWTGALKHAVACYAVYIKTAYLNGHKV